MKLDPSKRKAIATTEKIIEALAQKPTQAKSKDKPKVDLAKMAAELAERRMKQMKADGQK